MDSFREQVAAEVRAEMARQNISQETLSRAMNMNQATLSRRLNGRLPFTTDELAAAAHALGCPVNRFIPAITEDVST